MNVFQFILVWCFDVVVFTSVNVLYNARKCQLNHKNGKRIYILPPASSISSLHFLHISSTTSHKSKHFESALETLYKAGYKFKHACDSEPRVHSIARTRCESIIGRQPRQQLHVKRADGVRLVVRCCVAHPQSHHYSLSTAATLQAHV